MNILGDKGFHPSLIWGPQIINKAKPQRIKSASVWIMNTDTGSSLLGRSRNSKVLGDLEKSILDKCDGQVGGQIGL